MKRKLVIDTDGVVDDVRAVSLALQSSEAELLALTAVNGCVTVGQAVANLARTLRANGKRVPIYRGAEFPLVGNGHTHLDEVHFFGSDGLGNAPNAFPKVLPEDFEAHVKDKHAALALIALFQQHSDVTLVCIGPLTNVALALKLMPGFAKLPARLVMLGGNVHGMGNVRSYSTAEWNFSNDPEAAHIVLKEMQCPITLVPWETFVRESYQSAIDFHAHLDMDFPLANYFNTCTSIGRSILAKVDRQYAYCDEIAVGVAINPEGLIKSSKMLRASVELHGQLTRGQVAIDWYNYNPKVCTQRTPIQFVLDYDVHLLDQMIVHAIRSSLFAVAVEANGDSGSVEEKRALKEGSQS